MGELLVRRAVLHTVTGAGSAAVADRPVRAGQRSVDASSARLPVTAPTSIEAEPPPPPPGATAPLLGAPSTPAPTSAAVPAAAPVADDLSFVGRLRAVLHDRLGASGRCGGHRRRGVSPVAEISERLAQRNGCAVAVPDQQRVHRPRDRARHPRVRRCCCRSRCVDRPGADHAQGAARCGRRGRW